MIALKTKHICADPTFKLIWLGFPVLVVGTTDKGKHFHPFGIGVTSSETSVNFEFIFHPIAKGILMLTKQEYKPQALLADASPVITNWFTKAYNYNQLNTEARELVRIMCWAHVNINLDKKLKPINDTNFRENSYPR